MTRPVVEIQVNGPGGSVIYREGELAHSFGWDLGGNRVLATLYVPSPAEWDSAVPWAAGRREEVLRFVAAEVRRRKAPGCRIEAHERWIHLVEPMPLPARIASAVRRFLASFRGSA